MRAWRGAAVALCAVPLIAAAGAVGAQSSRAVVSFRVLEWNVSDSEWVKHAEATRAVLRHADADVFVLVQVGKGLAAPDIRRMLAGLRGPGDTTWFVSVRGADDYESSVIASRDSVRELPEFARVVYPDIGQTAALAARAAIPRTGEHVAPRDTVETVRTNGALVRVGNRWLLVAGVHLTCCGTPDSWREYRRQLGAMAIRDRMRAALATSAVQGAIAAGDMNLVAGAAALDTLLATATRAPLGPMRRADAVQPDGWTDWTWDGRGTPFNGGRLDNVIYSSGALTVLRARVWDTEFLPADTLRAHELTPTTSSSIGRHRPVVVDFRFEK